MHFGPDGMPDAVEVRGFTPNGDAGEHFSVTGGQAICKSPVDAGSAAYTAPAAYSRRRARAQLLMPHVYPSVLIDGKGPNSEYEEMFIPENGDPSAAYAPFVGTMPPAVERGFRQGGFAVPPDVTRADYRRSFAKLQELVGALHRAGIPIVAGTDGSGLEIVRELERRRRTAPRGRLRRPPGAARLIAATRGTVRSAVLRPRRRPARFDDRDRRHIDDAPDGRRGR